jgi:hypothetical protein
MIEMALRWWRTAEEMAAEFARQFPEHSDAEFLADCGLPNEPDAQRAALAVRRSVAAYGAVPPNNIYASHSYPRELPALSGWDSLDFVGWILELEEELGIPVNEAWFKKLPTEFSVRDLAHTVYAELASSKNVTAAD